MMVIVQQTRGQEHVASPSNFARLYVGVIEPQYPTWLWHDLPYYQGDINFYPGRDSYYGVVYDNVQLRFDQLEQRIVVLTPVGNAICVPEKEHVDWFEMDGHRYVTDPEDSTRYAALLSDGSKNGMRLYHSMWKTYDG